MRSGRNGPAVTPLSDGRVLVVGTLSANETGVEVPPAADASAEVYDVQTGSFTPAGELPALDLSEPEAAGVNVGLGTITPAPLVPLRDGGAPIIHQGTFFKHYGIAIRSLRFDASDGSWHEIVAPYISVEDPSSGAAYTSAGTTRFN